MGQGSYGKLHGFNDFLTSHEDLTWEATSTPLGEGWWMTSVNNGTINTVTDEPGGVVQFLTATADNDNVALQSGLYRPTDGQLWMEARFKVADDIANTAVFFGFTETLLQASPVIPLAFSGSTMAYAGTGGIAGLLWDSNATTNDWRAATGDGGAATAGAGNGTRANISSWSADEYIVLKVELGADGTSHMYVAMDGEQQLTRVASFIGGVTPGDNFYAALICQNLTGAALEFEVDYVGVSGYRDWSR